ncbi:uncharacterized protein LOC9321878 isoform X2 [Arabidopsis lyrata subsp. lyrata]|uniref:uncharacterized protein LOC9321878 isoform X2 n=1 Tax=Arabidopsis lyrata subsp. lyrata TaxID=81972 RepID=UPI000A29CBB8|nr:uncharacterized protein LOC9321878 isoform X2 [Arabidopsis lyrata subsp. lyrata]|eukprot:XP_020888435.1 uncharacterized protein LOC9321878 isoform X2 [Arabidopsis lyrata subsp. lyrata]
MKHHYLVTGNLEVLLEVTSISFYWLCYFSCRSSFDISPSRTVDSFVALLLRCCAFGCHRYLSTILCLSSPENTSPGLLQFQSKVEACCSSAICNRCIWIIMLVEAVCAGFFMGLYIGYVHQYNSVNSRPDVLKSLYSPLQPSSSMEGLRYYEGRLSDQQTALLQYQRENLHFLSEEILSLQEKLSKYEQSDDGSTPQVDLAHLLAARDQELRTLSAEMNQLQSELRLARSLIAERDAEVQRVNSTNNQYIEENERLRAILSEWSMRAANLERALEVERMSNSELQKEVAGGRRKQMLETTTSEQP